MVNITLQPLINLLKQKISNSSIQVWHILISFVICSMIIILSLIPVYSMNNNNKQVISRIYSAEFRIRWFNGSPDTYERSILSINDEIPAPTIIVEEGDIINIRIINEISESTTIHWHGLHQKNSLDMDGVPGITQCSILPNETFIYRYSTNDQTGTYWYHSHSAIQYGDGLKGILIIKDLNDPWKDFYKDEDILQLTDWYHTPVHIHLKSYLYPGKLDPVPDTILINGIGQFNCSLNNNCSYYRTSIEVNKTKRFRIINTSIYAKITLRIDEHQMRLIEVDGIYLNGKKYLDSIRLNPGQRYSVLIKAKQNSLRNFWIRATIHPFIELNNNYNSSIQPDAFAILQYNNNNNTIIDSILNDQLILNKSIVDGQIFSDESDLIPMNYTKYKIPINENIKTFIFNSQHKGKNPGSFYFNNQTFIHPTNQTLLSSILFDDNSQQQLNWLSTIQIEDNQIIDIIINNIDYAPHPFHLHGHHVWILAQGNTNDGYYNQSIIYNTNNPIYRDTFTVNPYSYIIFRFKPNNPGIWMMHCHNDWHLQLGMALIFIESSKKLKEFYSNQNLTNSIPFQCQHH